MRWKLLVRSLFNLSFFSILTLFLEALLPRICHFTISFAHTIRFLTLTSMARLSWSNQLWSVEKIWNVLMFIKTLGFSYLVRQGVCIVPWFSFCTLLALTCALQKFIGSLLSYSGGVGKTNCYDWEFIQKSFFALTN